MVAPIARVRRHVAERFPGGIGGHKDIGAAIIGPRDGDPVRIGVRHQLEAEEHVAGLDQHPVGIVQVLAGHVSASRIIADQVFLRLQQQCAGDGGGDLARDRPIGIALVDAIAQRRVGLLRAEPPFVHDKRGVSV